jgi:hypothetical protein
MSTTDGLERGHLESQATEILNNVARAPSVDSYLTVGPDALSVAAKVLVQHQTTYDGDPASIKFSPGCLVRFACFVIER